MKRYIIALIIILSLVCGKTQAQGIWVGSPYYFCAMNGTCYNDPNQQPNDLVKYVDTDYSSSTANYLTEQFMNAHPGFELLSPASLLYNCHGYAYSHCSGW